MKRLFIFLGIFIFLLIENVQNVRAAALKCSEGKSIVDLADHKADSSNITENVDVKTKYRERNKNSLNKLFHNIQCTLEKAKPWMAELQQEAKRLEEAAKLLGLGILNSFGEFVDKLVEETAATASTQNFTANAGANVTNSTATINEEISQYLCPEGFVADHNGICEPID